MARNGLVFSLFLPACITYDLDLEVFACTDDKQCVDAYRCYDGFCRPTSGDCGEFSPCPSGGGECEPATSYDCNPGYHRASIEEKKAYRCVCGARGTNKFNDACTSDDDCASGSCIANGGAGKGCTRACVTRSDCGGALSECLSGICGFPP